MYIIYPIELAFIMCVLIWFHLFHGTIYMPLSNVKENIWAEERPDKQESLIQKEDVFFSPLFCLSAGWRSGLASPQVIKVCEVCQSVLCTLRRTSWLPDCVWRDWLMRYWLPIESMDFWFGSIEVGKRGWWTQERGEDELWEFELPIAILIMFFIIFNW